ncbi:MAG: EscU/YscU/HrcU family type III secretion system export apparatus switch protein, partial [Pirellulaceae bacterium]|nr:EscU/YscU/HrcU family type III secretion system export apparatus switch protein [Pirellulaceae bacterium]
VPRVITKGQGSLAEEIVFAAQVKNIPLQDDHGLAHNLFRESAPQEAIHPDRFQQLARTYHEACQGNGLGRGNH